MIVYKITNKITGKSYIGKTVTPLEQRWKRHCKPTSSCFLLKRTIQKYGPGTFTVETVATCQSLSELNQKEVEFISKFNTIAPWGYNLTSGGEGGGSPCQELRDKMSSIMKGKNKKPKSEAHKKALSEARKKHSGPNKGKKFSEEHCRKISQTKLERNKIKQLLASND